ncbi:FAS1-like dehydratase domain-containing protein [Nocardia brevicatena]|uniref:FAS1-like dehydratase domain-containing protein n=1 Tax=Nocardia brevicatena TaxID=37327 RepID=UPI0002DD9168|nr:MaoC family dehydratase N-terminal domain-containing protein [Nocardia brevicatena]
MTRFSAYPVRLEHGKIGEFATAAMNTDPSYRGDEPIIPPTFLTTAAYFWQTEESRHAVAHGLDPQRTLHAEQEYLFPDGPPRAGTVLTATAHLADRIEKHGRRGGRLTFVTTVTDFRDRDGKLVAQQRSTAVQTAQAPTSTENGS